MAGLLCAGGGAGLTLTRRPEGPIHSTPLPQISTHGAAGGTLIPSQVPNPLSLVERATSLRVQATLDPAPKEPTRHFSGQHTACPSALERLPDTRRVCSLTSPISCDFLSGIKQEVEQICAVTHA